MIEKGHSMLDSPGDPTDEYYAVVHCVIPVVFFSAGLEALAILSKSQFAGGSLLNAFNLASGYSQATYISRL
jgi:hypothetical protein